MNKKALIVALVGILVAVGAIVLLTKKSDEKRVLGDDVQLFDVLGVDGSPSAHAFVRVPFLRAAEGNPTLKVAVDINKNDKFEANEWVADVPHVDTAKPWSDDFFFTVDPTNVSGARVRVELGKEILEKLVPFTPIEAPMKAPTNTP